MSRALLLAVPLAALALLAACGEKAALYGLVREPSGPVEAAEVIISSTTTEEAVTRTLSGRGGKFRFRNPLAAGTYVAEVRHPGYRRLTQTFTYPDTMSLDMELEPLVKVLGVLHLPDSSAASRAVVVFRSGNDSRIQVVADEGGSFVAEGLDPGEYVIEALTPDSLFQHRSRHELTVEQRVVELDLIMSAVKGDAGTATDTEPSEPKVLLEPSAPAKN